MADVAGRYSGLALSPPIAAAVEAVLPRMAERTVAAIVEEVPAYADPFRGRMGLNIENAVQVSLGAFLRLATRGGESGSGLSGALDGAYELGRGEARDGRSIDVLLAAYRVGARVSWQELSTTAVDAGLPAPAVARFAELVFAYIDELSASSVSGHGDELATAGRVRQRHLDRLARQLLAGEDPETLRATAELASWPTPESLTAILIPVAQIRRAATVLSPGYLQLTDELPGIDPGEFLTVVLVPDADGHRRSALLAALSGLRVVVGPARPWLQVKSSYLRAVRARSLNGDGLVDTDEHLAHLVLTADQDSVDDLRARALAPLADAGLKGVERLAETLRSWLLHQGRRDAVAADLFVHPQTVRYRMTQIRAAYGDKLNDPEAVLELIVALGVSRGAGGGAPKP